MLELNNYFKAQKAAVCSFAVFVVILAYHCYAYLKKVGVVDCMHAYFKARPVPQQDSEHDVYNTEHNGNGAQIQAVEPTFTEIRLDQLQESLLSDN